MCFLSLRERHGSPRGEGWGHQKPAPDHLFVHTRVCALRNSNTDVWGMHEIRAQLQTMFAVQMRLASECVICLEKEAVVAFIPCDHRCTCEGCAPSLRCCPVCRQPIREANRIFV